jgi:hypothetical protein
MPTEKCDGADNDCDDEVDEGTLCEAPANGTAVCNGAQGCAKICNAEFKDCDGRCIGIAEICGTACSAGFYSCRGMCMPGARPAEKCDGLDNDCNGTVDDGNLCPSPQNGSATCGGSAGCQSRCNANFRECGGVCAACPSVPNGTVACQGTSCVMNGCNGGYRNCGGRCVTCPSVSNGQVGCDGESCVLTTCNGGFYRDGNTCRACGATDPAHCGSSCRQCAGDQDCRQGACVARCTAGCQNDVETTCSGGNPTMKNCPNGCASGKCRPCPACNNTARCSGGDLITGETCNASRGVCEPQTQSCNGNGCNPGTNKCNQCNDNGDCPTCQECLGGSCQPMAEDERCRDPAGGACVVCMNGQCRPENNKGCQSGSGVCTGGTCKVCGARGGACCPPGIYDNRCGGGTGSCEGCVCGADNVCR